MYGHQTGKCCKMLYVVRDIPVRNRPLPTWETTWAYCIKLFPGEKLAGYFNQSFLPTGNQWEIHAYQSFFSGKSFMQ